MKVEPISNGNMRIWLSEEELSSDSDANVWRSVRRVLQAAQRRLSRMGSHIVAELIPVEGGQIVLLSARRSTPVGGPIVFYIDKLDELFCLAERWAAMTADTAYPRACLYAVDGGYALVLYPVTRLTRRQASLLREYGRPIGHTEAAAAHVAEYGRLLAAGDALEKLTVTARAPDQPEPSDRES